ncbi:hypothetical protein CROQUDRAFT_131164 [Cronartium quercuum f. sp. fusiforme G11]|uniref:Stealth protein CR3 conserved region 3 domain-containing protein n=1 Tax=Cronartium quercuum f. sp. fusiforme G11 TaxID=708437 RepID=A0A9P6NSK1_9BASI|nr:hypothetical protein CROQUDRAFT_131164 [Cronartium quercuum f. sp. fusiforme G11]
MNSLYQIKSKSPILPLSSLPTPSLAVPKFLIYRFLIIIISSSFALHHFIPSNLKSSFYVSTSFSTKSSTTSFFNHTIPTHNLTSTGWIPLRQLPSSSLSITKPHRPTQPERDISVTCASRWIANGVPCETDSSHRTTALIDILWTWVNGTKVKDHQPAYFFREHDELRYSLRSIHESVPFQLIRRLHLLTADFKDPTSQNMRMGSIPTWLNLSNHQLNLIHHSNTFKVLKHYLKSNGFKDDVEGASEWRESVVPSRNSLAIESQIPHSDGLGDALFYLNDDMFLLRKFSAGDLVTSLYGPVFRLQWDLKVSDRHPSELPGKDSNGEWPSLKYCLTNWLLSNRFGRRSRRYLHHVAKMLPVESMREVSNIWADELSKSASSKYHSELPEVNIPFLTTWYHIEKQREAILYSFIVLKSDTNADGKLSIMEREALLSPLGLLKNSTTIIMRPSRLSSHPVTLQNTLGSDEVPKLTVYNWVSSDGYPLQADGDEEYIDYSNSTPSALCTIELKKCFGDSSEISEIFKRVTYDKPECGDCLIAHIVSKSGPSGGLKFALANPKRPLFDWLLQSWIFKSCQITTDLTRMVDDEKNWKDLMVLHPSKPYQRRLMGVRLLQRYQYVLGTTPFAFRAITTEYGAKKFLRPLERPDNDIALVTVNDLIKEKGAEEVLSDWLKRMWPNSSAFEKKNHSK